MSDPSNEEEPFADPAEDVVSIDEESRNKFQPVTRPLPIVGVRQIPDDITPPAHEAGDTPKEDTDSDGEKILYSSRRHPKYLWKRIVVPALIGTALLAVLIIAFLLIPERSPSFTVMYVVLSILVLTPFAFVMRKAYIEWSEFILEVTTSVIRQYRAVSRLYYLRGPRLSEMSSLDKVSYLPHQPTIPELYLFRNSLTVTIGTKISRPDADEKEMARKELRQLKSKREIERPFDNMGDIWHPDELAAALKAAQEGH